MATTEGKGIAWKKIGLLNYAIGTNKYIFAIIILLNLYKMP